MTLNQTAHVEVEAKRDGRSTNRPIRSYRPGRGAMSYLDDRKAGWVGKTSPCIGCNGEIQTRIEDGQNTRIRVIHEDHCKAL